MDQLGNSALLRLVWLLIKVEDLEFSECIVCIVLRFIGSNPYSYTLSLIYPITAHAKMCVSRRKVYVKSAPVKQFGSVMPY